MGGIWGRAVTGSSRACRDSGSNRSSSAIHHAQLLALFSSATLVISAMAGGVVEGVPAVDQPTHETVLHSCDAALRHPQRLCLARAPAGTQGLQGAASAASHTPSGIHIDGWASLPAQPTAAPGLPYEVAVTRAGTAL